jgi:ABC-type polar amino acid transport system ATPase subunit
MIIAKYWKNKPILLVMGIVFITIVTKKLAGKGEFGKLALIRCMNGLESVESCIE